MVLQVFLSLLPTQRAIKEACTFKCGPDTAGYQKHDGVPLPYNTYRCIDETTIRATSSRWLITIATQFTVQRHELRPRNLRSCCQSYAFVTAWIWKCRWSYSMHSTAKIGCWNVGKAASVLWWALPQLCDDFAVVCQIYSRFGTISGSPTTQWMQGQCLNWDYCQHNHSHHAKGSPSVGMVSQIAHPYPQNNAPLDSERRLRYAICLLHADSAYAHQWAARHPLWNVSGELIRYRNGSRLSQKSNNIWWILGTLFRAQNTAGKCYLEDALIAQEEKCDCNFTCFFATLV